MFVLKGKDAGKSWILMATYIELPILRGLSS
jgi:hypothetical protein